MGRSEGKHGLSRLVRSHRKKCFQMYTRTAKKRRNALKCLGPQKGAWSFEAMYQAVKASTGAYLNLLYLVLELTDSLHMPMHIYVV